MSRTSAFSKKRSSWLAEAWTTITLAPSGISTPPTTAGFSARRRQATTEPDKRRHSSTALGIRAGLAQMASQAERFSSIRRKALPEAWAVVSCEATMPAIIIECR
ncbi:hypothetical protein D3C77_444300 [compost metagenome]